MVAAVAPYIDTSISKTVNVPAEYPYEDFQDALHERLEIRSQGLGDLPPQQRPWLGAFRRNNQAT